MYDYVIVGAGSAGCVLAARLSEDPDVSVCLIEAGGADVSPDIHVPAAFSKLFRTSYDWDYDTHDEDHMDRRRVYLPRGKVLGGTSSINTMIYIRGHKLDFDGWNVPGWAYDDLLPYFLRSEDNERGASAYHATGGPLPVSNNRSHNPLAQAFLAAAGEAGHPSTDDFNGAEQDGFGEFQLTQRGGMRASTAAAFLHPVAHRPNLTVETNLQVHRVLMENGRAVGVTGQRLDEEVTIRAGREVVLSAGAYNSPQLLQLSGVGPAGLLTALGIPVVADLPAVGANLQDHVLVPLIYLSPRPDSLLAAGDPANVELFQREQRGPLTSNGPEAGGFVRTNSRVEQPDVEFMCAPVMFADNGLAAPTDHAVSFGPSMIAPRSRGSVHIASANPTTKPRITHAFMAEKADLHDAVVALRMGLEIAKQPAFADYNDSPYKPPASDSDEDLAQYVRSYAHSIYHPASTCAIGAVVDDQLRVHGVEGLRVVDASVMPRLVSGNPNAPTIAIAEKAADLLRGLRPAA